MSNNDFMMRIIATLNNQLSKRQLKADLKTLNDSMYVKVIAKLSKTLSQRQLKKDLKQLNDLYVKVGADLKVDRNLKSKLQNRIKELQNSVSEIEIRTKIAKTKLNTDVDSARREAQTRAGRTPVSFDLEIKKNKAIADIEYLGKRFSRLFSNVSAKQKYQNLLTSAFSISDDSQLKSVGTQISAFTSELKANGLASKSLGDKWRGLIDKGKDLFSAAGIASAVFSQVRQSVSTFLRLDTAMTNLYKVQDQITSRDQFSGLLSKWNKLAQDLSLTTESLINSSAEWSKIGFDLDMSEQLAQITAIFEKTAEISNEKANSTLISVAQAFPEIDDLGEEDYVARVAAIGNKINKVGNEFAIDSEGVSDALQNSSAALHMANNTLDESIAIATTANAIFQSPDEVGNMSKILSARLRGQRGELEALNEDTDGLIESVNKIQTQILNLTHNKVNIFEADNKTLKSTYDIIQEIGRVYDSLSDKDQADLLEIIAGKQRMSAVASLLMNYQELEKVKNASMNADDSMQQEFDRYLESAEAHIITFQQKLIETYSTFMSGDLIKYAADAGSAVLDLVNSTDLLRHGILAVLALNFGKGISAIGAGVTSAVKQMNTLGNALQQVRGLDNSNIFREDALEQLGSATKSLTEKNLKLLLSQKQLSDEDRINILTMHGLTREEALAKLEKMGLTVATNAQTAANAAETTSTFTLSGAMNAPKASALGMWTAFKAAFAANPIGMILTLVTTAVSIFSTVMSKYSQEAEEAKQKAIELADKAAEESQRISELLTKYNQLTEEVKTNADVKDDLLSTQKDLLESLGIEQSEIDKLIGKYGSLSEAVNRVAVDKLKEKRSDLLAGYNEKKNDVLEIGKGYDNWYSINNRNMIDASGKEAVKAFKVLEKAGIVNKGSFGSGGGSLILTGDDNTIEGILENYQKLIDAENALSEAFSGEELSSNPLFTAINARKQQMEEAVESYHSSVDEINKNEASIQIFESPRGKELPKTEEEFESFKNKMVETAKGSKEFIGSQEDIEDSVINVLSSMSEFSQFFDNISKEEQQAADNISGKANASFKGIWEGLDKDIKDDILELAQAGALTVEKFSGMKGAEELMEKTGLSAEELTQKINKLVSSADHLASMKTGISSISSALGEKKDNLSEKKTANDSVSIDTLSSMPDDIKSCRKEYERFCEVLGNGSSTMEECKDAASKLATAYINNGNFLANLTEKNKDYYISVLKEMGIQNAEEIVLDALSRKKAEAAVQTMNFTNKTGEEIVKLLEEQGALNGTTEALKLYALKKIYANGNGLNTTNDINQLIALVKSLGYSTAAIDKYNEARNSAFKPAKNKQDAMDTASDILNGKKRVNSLVTDKVQYTEQAKSDAASYIDGIIAKMEKTKVKPPTISPTGDSSTKDKGKSAKAKESKQEIDWLSRMLDTLQNKVDMLKAKFENLFSVGKKENNLDSQIKKTTKLLSAQEKAASRYQKIADNYYQKNKKKFSQNGITLSMLQNGSYDVKSYKSSVSEIIKTYEDYYDKAQESKKATLELIATIKELSKQKLELKLDDNERKRTYQEAKYANATTAKEKRKILNKEINTYKADNKAYKNYYQEAKKQRNADGKTAKTAVNKTKGLGKTAKDKIKNLIKQGKEIPSALMKKVQKVSASTYKELVDYNNSVDFVSDALRDKKLANEQNETYMREKRIERAQNYADEAEAKYNLNQQYEENAVTAKDKNKYETESLKYLNKQYDKLIKIAELEGDVTEQKRLQAERQEKINESYQKMYDNIKTEYENKTGLNDAKIATTQAEIATLEAAGKSVSKEMYEGMMKLVSGKREKLLGELAELEEAGKNFEYNSPEWYAWQNDLETVKQGLYDCTQQSIEFQKKVNELDFKKFTLAAAQLDATKSHLDFLVDMLSHQDLTSKESGGLTDAGMATISLRFANMDNYRNIIKNAQANLAKLHEDHINGKDFLTEEEYLAKREEQLDIIRDSTEAIADEKDAILDLVENAMQLQIDSINELIEKKKKALATEKDLYEYQKKVSKQTKNIALIQKQLAALSGDNSEEARAKMQKLQVSLEEAQEELRDTEYDKWHDDQTDMLDSLADEVEDFWERIMNDLKKDINGSLDNILKMITDNPDAIARALDALGLGDALSIITTYNPDGTHTDKGIDYGGNSYESTYNKDGVNTANDFKTGYEKYLDNIHSDIEGIGSLVGNLKDDAEETARAREEEAKRAAEEAMRKAREEEEAKAQAQIRKDNAVTAVYARADSIMQQSADGVKKFVVDKVPMEGVKAVVGEFLESSALHKPTTEAGKKRMKTDPLLKYIAENYKGKTLSNVNEARLGAYLGISVKDKNNVSASEADKILKAFRNAGFAKGGIADTLNKAATENGDDGIITIQRGEAVLTKAQTEAVQDMADRFVKAEPQFTEQQLNVLKGIIETPPDYSDVVPKLENATVNNNNTMNASVNVDSVNVHLDGSGVTDMESMFEQLNQPRNRMRMQNCVFGDIKNPMLTSLKKF